MPWDEFLILIAGALATAVIVAGFALLLGV